MVHAPNLQPESDASSNRDVDPNVLQRKASDPAACAWVSASAGTGKTKVLTDRVLRLLLPARDGTPGTAPHKILCLTFTKAAASEMSLRLNKRLSRWAVADEDALRADLERNLLGRAPTPRECEEARKLFARVLDVPGGLKIMTIHSFCQSVLGRFPLEAGVPPGSEVLDEELAAKLLQGALNRVLDRARAETGSPLHAALASVAGDQNEEQFRALLKNLTSERNQMKSALEKFWSPGGLHAALCEFFAVNQTDTADALVRAACDERAFAASDLRRACTALACGTQTDKTSALMLQVWLDCAGEDRVEFWKAHIANFIKKSDGLPRTHHFPTKSVKAAFPDCERILRAESDRLVSVLESCKAVRCAALTRDLFELGGEIVDAYQADKERRGVLDYDDLILKTLALLKGESMAGLGKSAAWVLYKLDQGLDHILIDEAQDTNPEQWRIVEALCDEFFAGAGARDDRARTLFTVGDVKQSIYSFQRAAPEEFERMRADLRRKAEQAGRRWENVPLNISFRTVRSVLSLVDETFADPAVRHGLGEGYDNHVSFRRGQAGLAEIWPLEESDDKEDVDPWSPPVDVIETRSGQSKLARKIAETVEGWLERGERLESADRPIEPGDIMILVRTRNAFVGRLTRELKEKKIPVSGLDRMVLNEQLAVQDLLALAQFALLPEDDLTLACILKSPFLGMDEDDLFALAYKRKGSLWQALKKAAGEGNALSPRGDLRTAVNWLQSLIRRGGEDHPYEFFARILQTPCPAHAGSGLQAVKGRLGEDALDPLEELLGAALQFEQRDIPTLQGFLQRQSRGESQIKRELEEAGGQIRIMTVHGSKGLQAPVVILPDTVKANGAGKISRLLWPDKSDLPFPLWSPRKDGEPAAFTEAFARVEARMEEEYRRLLYVAMTRAEDRLYVCGAKSGKSVDEGSWYRLIENAFDRAPETEHDAGTGLRRIRNPQTDKPDRTREERAASAVSHAPPDWLAVPAPVEPTPPTPLTPSRPSEPTPSARSPLAGNDPYRFKRGNLTHKLLQILPDLPESDREGAAHKFVANSGHDLPGPMRAEIVREALSILTSPGFAPIFGPGSMAEVPISGLLDGERIVNGQIDRLVVTPNEILIVDYKTNRPPPDDERDVPAHYREQMRAYAGILRQIYPDRPVRCALLWTDGPRFMPLTNL